MWDVMLRRWLDLLFWWAPRRQREPRGTGQPGRASEPVARPSASSARPGPQQAADRSAQTAGGASRSAEPATRTASRPAEPVTPRAAEPSARAAAKPAAQPDKTVAPPVPDDLTVIKGIGPAVQNKLRGLGITTFADLAAADPDAILRGLKGSQPLTRGKVQAWTDAARERART